jgi:hypothetical protein
MIEILRPGFLWAGALFALLPLLLHFLVPRTRRRRLLPTARFLTPSARTRIRIQRRPTDPKLLALRMAFALILAAAFAGVFWHGWGGGGTVSLLLVDGGERYGPGWSSVQEAALDRWTTGTRVAVVEGVDESGTPRTRSGEPADEGELLRFLAGTQGEGGPGTLALLLRGLRREGAALGPADSVRAVLVSGARAGSWTPGLVRVRWDLWPATIEWVGPDFPDPAPLPWVELDVPPGQEERFASAFAAAGWRVGNSADGVGSEEMEAVFQEGASPLRIHLQVAPLAPRGVYPPGEAPGSAPGGDPLWRLPGVGDREGGAGDGELREGPAEGAQTEFVLPDGRRFPAWGPEVPGTPTAGAMVPLFRSGGRPAASARQEGPSGIGRAPTCRVLLPLAPGPGTAQTEGGASEIGGAGLPDLLDGILRWGCPLADPTPLALALDVRALLETPGQSGSDQVAVRDLRSPQDGARLTPWLLALALLLLGTEAGVIRRRRNRDAVAGEGGNGSGADGETQMTEGT